MYLQIQGVKGESFDKDHEGWIDILSYSGSLMHSASATAGRGCNRGAVSMGDITLTKQIDKAAPQRSIKRGQRGSGGKGNAERFAGRRAVPGRCTLRAGHALCEEKRQRLVPVRTGKTDDAENYEKQGGRFGNGAGIWDGSGLGIDCLSEPLRVTSFLARVYLLYRGTDGRPVACAGMH